jgi:carboxyl-terminal processing protease
LSADQLAQLSRISEAFLKIERNYVDPVEDRQLVGGCRLGMLRVAPTPSIPERSDAVKGSTQALQEISTDFSAIQQQSPGGVGDEKLADACMQGMVGTLDDRSAFFDAEAFKELQGGMAGIGVELGMEPGRLMVLTAIEGGPAWRAGLKGGDAIVQIDDAPIGGPSLSQAMKPLRGPAGSRVKISVERPGDKHPMVFTLTREVIVIQSVKWALLPGGIAYIRITQFPEHVGEKLASAITAAYAQNQGDLNGLILDLRNNPGGLLNQSIAVSAAFLPQNSLVVFTDGRNQDSKMRLYASSEYYLRGNREDYFKKLHPSVRNGLPMVVLVNHTTAAASEIVAAALQDHKRATIIGERTFGVETIQTILPLNGGAALKLTTARYFRPSGGPIGPVGITPDIVFDEGPDKNNLSYDNAPGDDPAVARAAELLREKASAAKPQ